MTYAKQYPEWVILEAARRSNTAVTVVRREITHSPAYRALCDLIMETQTETNPDLIEARKILAKAYEDWHLVGAAKDIRAGKWDNGVSMDALIAAIKSRPQP